MQISPSPRASVCVVTRRQSEEMGRQGGPVFPLRPVWPQRNGCRRRRGHVPSRREHSSGSEQERESGPFPPWTWPFAPPASVSSRAPLWSLPAVTAQVTANQHAGPGNEPCLGPATPSLPAYLHVSPDCVGVLLFLLVLYFYLPSLPSAPSHPDSLSKHSLILLLARSQSSSHTVSLSRLFLLDAPLYLTEALLTPLEVLQVESVVHLIRAGLITLEFTETFSIRSP